MESILHQLFSGDYDITPERDKKQQELSKTILDGWDKVAAVFGTEFADDLCLLEAEREELRDYQYFRTGFALGVRLMLEALEI